ncbi:MAG: hypothetical protein ABI051_18120 [Vicinamibacterales bacterium]
MPTLFTLPAAARRGFDRMAADCRRVFEDRFVALVASGPDSGVVFAHGIGPGDLEALGALTDTWHHDGLGTPLLLTPEEFRRSLDAFPIEYQAIIDRHVLIAGTAPFQDIEVDRQHLRRACEVQAKSHLLHLRQGWMEATGHDDRLATLIAQSATPLHALLSNVARLQGANTDDSKHAALAGARCAGLDEDLVRQILLLESAPDHARHLVRRLHEYLQASERLWAFVDGWTT